MQQKCYIELTAEYSRQKKTVRKFWKKEYIQPEEEESIQRRVKEYLKYQLERRYLELNKQRILALKEEWIIYGLDLIVKLSLSKEKDVIMIIIDYITGRIRLEIYLER